MDVDVWHAPVRVDVLEIFSSEQKRRFLARINTPGEELEVFPCRRQRAGYWDDYMNAFEDAFHHTSAAWVPWHIIPADNKWFTRMAVADVIITKLKALNLRYLVVNEEHRQNLLTARELLENEPS